MIEKLKSWARTVKTDIVSLYIALKDTRTPLLAKVIAVSVVTYALSPIDLIPDFIPVIGYLDDLLIVPLGILLAVRLIPVPLMAEFRSLAADHELLPKNQTGAIIVVCTWLICTIAIGWWAINSYG